MFKMCYMKYFMFYVYYCTNCAAMFTYSSKMSDISTAGKSGRVCECCLCHLRGEKHYVLRHVFSKHLTFHEWPYSCPVCQYCHYDYTNFRKHPQWYSLRTALKGTSAVPLPSSAEVREESKVVYSMTRQLSIEDSADHWKRRQRAPATVRPSTKLAASIQILPTPTSSSGLSVDFQRLCHVLFQWWLLQHLCMLTPLVEWLPCCQFQMQQCLWFVFPRLLLQLFRLCLLPRKMLRSFQNS